MEERVCVIFLSFSLFMLLYVPPGYTIYIFHTPMARYGLFVLKVSLNTNKPNLIVHMPYIIPSEGTFLPNYSLEMFAIHVMCGSKNYVLVAQTYCIGCIVMNHRISLC